MAEEREMLSLGQINGYRLTTFLAPLTGCFVDYTANSCDFQTETFLCLLAYLKNTPPVEEEKAAYHRGMLSIESILENKAQIGEGRFTVGGYPDGLENSYHMSASSMIVLTEITSETNEFLQFLLSEAVQPSSIDEKRFLDASLPVTKQALTSLLADAETREFYWRKTDTNMITGGNSDIYIVPSSPDEKQIINRKGVPVSFTDEDTALLTAVLGAPFSGSFRSAMPDEIREILYEEFSAYVAADMSDENCARNIQSRVALYLAERS